MRWQNNLAPLPGFGKRPSTSLSLVGETKPALYSSQLPGWLITFSLLMMLAASQASLAGELVYQPVNPSFGGNPINGSYLLSTAQSQNDFKDPDSRGSAFSQRSALDRFTDSLESRLLNQLMGDIGQGNSGTLVTDDFIVDIVDNDGVLTVLITDLETNETSEIEVSGLNPGN